MLMHLLFPSVACLPHARCLLNYLVRPRQYVRRNRQTDLLGGFQINDEFELHRLLYWEVGGLRALENLVHICSGTSELIDTHRSVGHEAASLGPLPVCIYSR